MSDTQLADVLFHGMVHGIRNELKQKLMNELEKDIDGHVYLALSQLKKMYLEKDFLNDRLNLTIIKQPIKGTNETAEK